ncbi:hypothetical protein K1719_029105 [Acacia pycnantha]|nr:hypothetical protein K1719_029105 [Acacia pycnantha]
MRESTNHTIIWERTDEIILEWVPAPPSFSMDRETAITEGIESLKDALAFSLHIRQRRGSAESICKLTKDMDHTPDDVFKRLSSPDSRLQQKDSWYEGNDLSVFFDTNTIADTGGAAGTTTSASSLFSSPSSGFASFCDKSAGSSSPQSSYNPAFDDSSIIRATADYNAGYEKHEAANTRASSLKRTLENNESESKADLKTKMSGSSLETWRHRMSERKRRRELSQKFVAIPDLKKDMDHTPDNYFSLESIFKEICPSGFFNTNTTADTGGAAVTTTSATQSRHDSPSSGFASFCDKSAGSSSPQPSYNPPLDDSSIIGDSFIPPEMPDCYEALLNFEKHEAANTRASSLKRTLEKDESESKADQKTKMSRSSSETLSHTKSERIRRQELSQKFIAISARMPDLKKFDKLSVLSEAINYMEKLEGRVKELEEQKKISDDRELFLMSTINDHHHHQDTVSSCTSDDKCFRIINQGLPEI